MKPSVIQNSVDRRRQRLNLRDEVDLRHLLDIIAGYAPKLVDRALDLQDDRPIAMDDQHATWMVEDEQVRRD